MTNYLRSSLALGAAVTGLALTPLACDQGEVPKEDACAGPEQVDDVANTVVCAQGQIKENVLSSCYVERTSGEQVKLIDAKTACYSTQDIIDNLICQEQEGSLSPETVGTQDACDIAAELSGILNPHEGTLIKDYCLATDSMVCVSAYTFKPLNPSDSNNSYKDICPDGLNTTIDNSLATVCNTSFDALSQLPASCDIPPLDIEQMAGIDAVTTCQAQVATELLFNNNGFLKVPFNQTEGYYWVKDAGDCHATEVQPTNIVVQCANSDEVFKLLKCSPDWTPYKTLGTNAYGALGALNNPNYSKSLVQTGNFGSTGHLKCLITVEYDLVQSSSPDCDRFYANYTPADPFGINKDSECGAFFAGWANENDILNACVQNPQNSQGIADTFLNK